jgi:hypothetical protein
MGDLLSGAAADDIVLAAVAIGLIAEVTHDPVDRWAAAAVRPRCGRR